VFETLLVLVQHSEQVVSKGDLLKTVWPDSFVEESNLSQSIFLLRKVLGETAQDLATSSRFRDGDIASRKLSG
jgi:DNA-binding winged helix-turn-helix (wHTH) protein